MVELVSGNGLIVYSLALIFLIWAFLRNLKRFRNSHQKLIKNYYLRALIISILMILAVVLGLFNKVLISLVLFFILAIISVLILPATLRARRVENEKILANLHGKDLALVDLFTHHGWLKMAQRWGCWNSTLIIFVITLILMFILMLGVDLLVYGEFNLVRVLFSALIMSLILSAFFYLTVRRTKDKVIFWGK